MAERVWVSNPLKNWKAGDRPHDPIVILVLSQSLGEIEGFAKLTTNLASDSEIDFEIARLKADLDSAGKEAKRILKDQKRKILNSLGNSQPKKLLNPDISSELPKYE